MTILWANVRRVEKTQKFDFGTYATLPEYHIKQMRAVTAIYAMIHVSFIIMIIAA